VDITQGFSTRLDPGIDVTSSGREPVFFKSAALLAKWSLVTWWEACTTWEFMVDTKAGSGWCWVNIYCILLHPNQCFRAYIIDGSISLPMAIAGFFLLPDVPEITKSWYLSEEVSLPPCFHQTTTNIRTGNQIVSVANEAGRQRTAVQIHQSQTQADFFVLAYLSDNHCLCVSEVLPLGHWVIFW